MNVFAIVSGATGAIAFAVLAGLIALAPGRHAIGRYLLAASFGSMLWLAALAAHQLLALPVTASLIWLYALEILRNALWFLFLGRVLDFGGHDPGLQWRVRVMFGGIAAVLLTAMAIVGLSDQMRALLDVDAMQLRKLHFACGLALALAGLVLTEQILRNTARDARWRLKHLCLGIGLVFAFDFYLYADAVLFNRIDAMIWTSRGFVNALAVPMIAVSVARNRDWQLDIFVSRRVVFHGVSLVAAGGYLLAMSAAGYYIQLFGGEWGRALKFVFFSAALLVLLSLFSSLQLRSRLRGFLARHFYRNKYEYGEEWLKFTEALSRVALDPASLNGTILRTIADIVDSPGGLVCQKQLREPSRSSPP